MNFNDLKRKVFFWIERLQISQKERITFSLLFVVLAILITSTIAIQKTYNYSQEKYDRIVAEYEKKSLLIEQEQKELEMKYNPSSEVNEADEKTAAQQADIEETVPEEPVSTSPVNINTATSAELQTLDGIGPAYAERIIEYREENGGFDSIEELINIKGIGEKRLANIRSLVTLEN